MNKSIFLIVLFFSSYVSFSQQVDLSGKILDNTTHLPIKNAVVMLLSEKDSVIQGFARTKNDGSFLIANMLPGKKILMITHPIFADYIDDIFINKNQQLGSIEMINKTKLMSEIIIKTGGAIRIKGDTTIYTADSFNVSANANAEELLKKLPGIQVDKNGEIKAMGEKVQKVLVDGEEFFGDDPGMAVKNLRADAIKEVQVFDKKTDQAAFTGIDDGKSIKTINLKLKEDKKKGYFGKVALSGGKGKDITNRFNNNVMFGSFKGKRKISAFILNGNTGQDGLSWQENQKYGDNEGNSFEMTDEDGIFNISFSNVNNDEVYINPENGFMRNVNVGMQYSNKLNNNNTINFSPKYNEQDYYNIKDVNTITQLSDSSFYQKSKVVNTVKRYNYKNSLIYDVKIDTNNTLKVTVRANYFHTNSEELTNNETTGNNFNTKNSSTRNNKILSDRNYLSGNLIFNHRFSKPRRTLSLKLDWNQNRTDADNFLNSDNTFFYNNTPIVYSIDQLTQSNNNSDRTSSKITYTEPLTKKWSMELGYDLTIDKATNNQITFSKSPINNLYVDAVDSLTNDFNQNIIIHTPSARFNYSLKKIKINFGSGFGITNYDLLDNTTQKDYLRQYTNLFPSASFVYNYKSNHAFRIKYNGSNSQPTINQLQPLRNNTNLFDQYIGNPDLKPSFSHNINLTQNGYNFLKNQWNFISLNLTFTNNAITYNRIVNPLSGATISQPINTNGNMNVNVWTGIGFKEKKSGINIEIMPTGNFSRFADVINNQLSYSNTVSTGISCILNKSMTDKYDVVVKNDCSGNINKNAQNSTQNKFLTNTTSINATIYYQKTWSFISDYQFFYRGKVNNQNNDFSNHLLNIQLQKTFKNNEYTLYFKVRDLLNQNIGIDRSFFGNTFTDATNTRLKRYFMIGLSWDFKNKKK